LAEWLLNFVPEWIAPNLITFSSLIMMSLVHLLFMFCGENLNGVVTWKLVMMAVSIFIYQNMDNLDGKQARKTRTF
jgi:phosphatidylglycerophosphate synthase